MDFTLKTYTQLLKALQSQGFSFQTFEQFIDRPQNKVVILRHDVDRLPKNSLQIAKIEAELEIKGSYYFRIVKESNQPEIIKQIAELGHEIGYHYEDLTTAKGDANKAFELFQKHLLYFKQFYPVRTICMHGSPMSKYDSRDIWKKYDYKTLGIIGEPYFDIDFSKVLYLTDTGRRWDGDKVSVRDKPMEKGEGRKGERRREEGLKMRCTIDIISFLSSTSILPSQIMFTLHPQRWTNNALLWTKELVMQNAKNIIKRYFFVK